jgi:DinB family protein
MLPWFERHLTFDRPIEMLPFYLERLNGTMARIKSKVNGIPDDVLSQKLDDKWSIKQNIGHLAEVDEISNKRMDEMMSAAAMLSPAVFEPNDYNPWSIEKVVALFYKNRKLNLEKYKSLSLRDLQMSSMHPRLHLKMTPVDLAWFDAEHDDHHLVRINEIIETLTQPL